MSTLGQVVIAPDFDETAFDPKAYNNTYYSSVMQDERGLIEWQANELHARITAHLDSLGIDRFSHQFDAGSGPAVQHLMALEKYSNAIDLADYLPENLAEIKGWADRTDPNAHDWAQFTRETLVAEGLPATEQDVAARENAVRAKIQSYNSLDFKNPTPAMLTYKAPFVTSYFVADSATGDKQVFNEMTKVAFDIVVPGGLFVGAYLGECKEYAVGDKWVVSADLNQADIMHALVCSGAINIQIKRIDTPELAPEGFDHVFAVSAQAPELY